MVVTTVVVRVAVLKAAAYEVVRVVEEGMQVMVGSWEVVGAQV